MVEASPHRSVGLDLARTIAILAVVWVHTTNIQSGAFGVQLFFIISGYLLADFRRNYTSSEFLLNRFLRLFPLAIAMTTLFYFRFDSSVEFLTSLLLLNGFFTSVTSFPGGWSISSEWIYSWFNLFVVRMTLRIKVLVLIALLGTGLLVDLNNSFSSNSWGELDFSILLLTYFSFFLVGNILSMVSEGFNFRIFRGPTFLLVALVPLFTINNKLPQSFYFVLLTLIFISALGLEIRNKRAVSIIHFIGKRTYGTFCGHFIVLIGVENLDPNNQIRNHFSSFAELLTFFFVLACGLALGAFSYKFIERPIILLSHAYIRRRRLNNF